MPPGQSMNVSSETRIAGSMGGGNNVSLCDTLDRVLNKGAVVCGEVIISVAGVDLLYLGIQLTLTSVETARAAVLAPRPLIRHELRDNTA